MSIRKSHAIILKRHKVRETSLAVTFYTKDYGKLSGLAKGVRQPRSRFAGVFETFNEVYIVFYDRKREGLHTIDECDLIEPFNGIREDLKRLAFGWVFVELLNELTPAYEKNISLFNLLEQALKNLSYAEQPILVNHIYTVKLLSICGIIPRYDSCVKCEDRRHSEEKNSFSISLGGVICSKCLEKERPKDVRYLNSGTLSSIRHIDNGSWEDLSRLKFTKGVLEEMRELFRDVAEWHIGKRLKSMEFLESIDQL